MTRLRRLVPPDPMPPADLWPASTPPDCPSCETPDGVVWDGYAYLLDTDHDGLMWQCRTCRGAWGTLTTRWPVYDGPACPVCNAAATRWQAIAPDHHGDTWECPTGHEFVIDPEGFVFVPGLGGAA